MEAGSLIVTAIINSPVMDSADPVISQGVLFKAGLGAPSPEAQSISAGTTTSAVIGRTGGSSCSTTSYP